MFVNKLKRLAPVTAFMASVAILTGMILPFYAYAINTQNEHRGNRINICYYGGQDLYLIKMNELTYMEPVEKPGLVTVNDKGESKNFFTQAVDCGTFLLDAGVTVSHNDILSLPENTILEDKSFINVDRVEYKTEIRTEAVAYGTKEIGIDTIPKGTRELVSAGKNGTATRTYLVKYINGKAVEEAVYDETILQHPTDEVVNVGIGGTVTAKDGTVYSYSYRKQMEATAYTYLPPYTTMTTATGQTLRKGIVAVDPKVIPLHTKMFITGSVEYGLGVAEDTGGAIKGNIIDLAYMSYNECIQFGRRQMQVYILE